MKFSIDEARKIRTEKIIKERWLEYKDWAAKNETRLLKFDEGNGRSYGPESEQEFREAWLSMPGSNKLNQIKEYALHKTSFKVAKAMRNKLIENKLPDTLKDIDSLSPSQLKLRNKEIRKLKQQFTLEEARKTGTHEYKEKYLDKAIKEFADRMKAKRKIELYDSEKEKYLDELSEVNGREINIWNDAMELQLIERINKIVNNELKQAVTTEFFGGS